jgi:chitin disaccharide deacetylase
MLIVNADDLGRRAEDTDRTLACHRRGCLTSASAMAFMADSARAAALTSHRELPIGLHLNLSERFTAAGVPTRLRDAHDRICGFLTRSRYAPVLYHPLLRSDFARVVEAQFDEFRRLYGREPAHVDGHQHMHLCSNVLLQHLLPQGMKVRRNFTFGPGEKTSLNRRYRALVDRALARRHPLTACFFSLSQQMARSRLDTVFALALEADVELMIHPAWQHEFDVVTSDAFIAEFDRANARAPAFRTLSALA